MENINHEEIVELRKIAETHLTKEVFTWTIGIILTIASIIFTYESSRITKLEVSDNAKNVEFAKIQVQLSQVMEKQDELKALLIAHEQKTSK